MERDAAEKEISKEEVKKHLDATNSAFVVVKFQITDKMPDQPVAQGTQAAVLKTRFVPGKLKK